MQGYYIQRGAFSRGVSRGSLRAPLLGVVTLLHENDAVRRFAGRWRKRRGGWRPRIAPSGGRGTLGDVFNDARRRDASGPRAVPQRAGHELSRRVYCVFVVLSTCRPCKFMHVRRTGRLVFSRSSTRTRAPKYDDYEFRLEFGDDPW